MLRGAPFGINHFYAVDFPGPRLVPRFGANSWPRGVEHVNPAPPSARDPLRVEAKRRGGVRVTELRTAVRGGNRALDRGNPLNV
jgi:hypothetical protein